jgi:hypothetical protein
MYHHHSKELYSGQMKLHQRKIPSVIRSQIWQDYKDRNINRKRRKGEEGNEKTEGISNNIEETTVRKIKETTRKAFRRRFK